MIEVDQNLIDGLGSTLTIRNAPIPSFWYVEILLIHSQTGFMDKSLLSRPSIPIQFMNIASNTPASPTSDSMPSEKVFLRQAELVWDALKVFLVVHDIDSTNVIRAALTELINLMVCRRLLLSPDFNF